MSENKPRSRKRVVDVSSAPAAAPAKKPEKPSTSEEKWEKAAAAAPAGASFADLLGSEPVPEAPKAKVGDAVSGTVVHSGNDGIFVDLGGARQQAFFPRSELLNAQGEVTAKVGDSIKGFVTKVAPDGTLELGKGLGRGMGLEELEAAMREKIPVTGKVSGVNKGGVQVDLGGLRAFCPISQLENRFVNDASIYLQQTLQFHVVEVKEDGRDVVLSRRAILEAEAAEGRAALMETLKPGARMHGRVVRVRDFGAFVDLGGVDGLIPTRELSHARLRPDQVVSEGQSVEVMVQEVTEKDGDLRITLSLKDLADDPWDNVDSVAPQGTVVQGTVRRLMDFGAFVELAPGVEGLLHVSELGAGARHPSSFLHVGQTLLVTVQSVDPSKKRISLAPAPKDAEAGTRVVARSLRIGDVVDVVANKVERFGIFVQVEGTTGRAGRGLVPMRELGVAEGTDVRKLYPEGKTFQAKVIDTTKLALSVKAIAEDEERALVKSYQEKTQAAGGMGTFADLLGKLKS